jgi:antitoxin VapB
MVYLFNIYHWSNKMDIAKLFWSGRSQAVRLPKEFRFEGEAVRIRRHGANVVLEPIPTDWNWLDALPGRLDADVATAANEQASAQERPGLDKLFR